MSEPAPEIVPRDDGGLDLEGVPELLAWLLLGLPETIAADAPPEARARLFPDISEDDEDANVEWRRIAHPELFHLLASAREVVEADLRLLVMTLADGGRGRLEIPGKHREAWISALQAARLSIGAEHGLDVYDPAPPPAGGENARVLAEVKMAVYADLQWQLVDGATRDLPDAEG